MDQSSIRWLCAVVLALAFSGAGCSRCGGNDTSTDSGNATQRLDAALGLAELAPADVGAFFVARDLSSISQQYAWLRPRIDALVGNVGMIETDLRNTLGIDLMRLDDLGAIGVDARGGIGIALVGTQPVILARLSDSQTFVAHMTSTGQGQPFNLGAPLEESGVAGARLYRMRRTADGPVKLSFAVNGRVAYIFGDARADEAMLARLVAVEAAASLASNPAWIAAVGRNASATAVFYVDPAHSVDAAFGSGGPAVDADLVALLGRFTQSSQLTGGLSFRPQQIELTTATTPPTALLAELERGSGAVATNPDFSRLVGPDAYFVARSTVAPTQVLAAVRSMLTDRQKADVDEFFASATTRFGIDIEHDLLPALGPNALLLATRARMLTLRRVIQSSTPNPGEAATAFGLVLAIEVRDRAAVLRALDAMVTALQGRAERFESGANTVVGFTDQQADIGNIVLTENFLIVVPTRNRDEVLAQLASAPAEGQQLRSEDARALVNDVVANGIFVDLMAVVTGPIGSTLGPMLPDEALRAAGNFDSILLRSELAEGQIRSRLLIQFATTPAGAPEGSGGAP